MTIRDDEITPAETVPLEFFDGKTFILTGTRPIDWTPPVEGMYLTLDGVTYAVLEDPDDGRAMLDRVIVAGRMVLTNIPPTPVVGEHKPGPFEGGGIVTLRDAKTGKAVIVFGTGDAGSYYPYFIATYDPTALAANIPA